MACTRDTNTYTVIEVIRILIYFDVFQMHVNTVTVHILSRLIENKFVKWLVATNYFKRLQFLSSGFSLCLVYSDGFMEM